jgi:hypothetical protein
MDTLEPVAAVLVGISWLAMRVTGRGTERNA